MQATIFICVILLNLFSSRQCYSTNKEKKCEKNKATLCDGLYNETRFPNHFGQRLQDDAVLSLNEYGALVATNCAEHLRLFLCSLFVPMCTMLDENLLPCRNLCNEVKNGCEKILMQYVGLSWPERLNCNQFPVSGAGKICIEDKRKKQVQPKIGVVRKVRADTKTKIGEDETAILSCSRKKIVFRRIIHENDKCQRDLSLLNIRKKCNGEHQCEFRIKDLAKLPGQSNECRSENIGPAYIKYHCKADKPAKQMKLKYGKDANLYCKSSHRHIKIIRVLFKEENEAKTCSPANAFCRVTQACTGKQNCVLWANLSYILPTRSRENKTWCKDKNHNWKPELTVYYECEKTPGEEKKVENYLENVKLQCPAGGKLNIIRAEYTKTSCLLTKNIHCGVKIICTNKQKCVLDGSTHKDVYEAIKCDKERSKIRIRYTCI